MKPTRSPVERRAYPRGSVSQKLLKASAAVVLGMAPWSLVWGADASAAEKTLKDHKCVKCHAADRAKDGPAYRDVGAKFRGLPDAHNKLIHHFTSGEMVTFPDGHKEKHRSAKEASPAELKNLAEWILSLEGGKKY